MFFVVEWGITQIIKNKFPSSTMDEACSKYGVTEKYVGNFGWKTSRKETTPGTDGRIILRKYCGVMD
jgi:hypothetical protein